MLYVNADDMGRNGEITDRILACYREQRIGTASMMVFMEDSTRAAELVIECGLPVGLHLNFTQAFTGRSGESTLEDCQRSVAAYLKTRRINAIVYSPLLRKAFNYLFQAQWDEFCCLYGKEPAWLDGHHHMHLCMNMLASGKLPRGIRIRRNFTFASGEKDPVNRLYRYLVDRWLKSRFECTDYFFSLSPIEHKRVQRILTLSRSADVELMVHPGVDEEYHFLLSEEWGKQIAKRPEC